MNMRQFLAAGALSAALPFSARAARTGVRTGPGLLTVAGAIARGNRMIVATMRDGAPMSVGGLGPLWAVYDADRLPAFKDKPLKERFALCPWGLYFIDVKAL